MIKAKDNSIYFVPAGENFDNLRWLAKQPISKLGADEGGNLLVFPHSFDKYGDKIGDEYIFAIKDENRLQMGNIMGFIGYNGTEISICSRFAHDENDYFLHYMLQRVFAINLFDLKHDFDKDSIFDFLLFLFPVFLKRALRQGLYKEYQSRQYNDANVKGRIDVQRHIRINNPFAGKIAYTAREYSFDNKVTQLIRHTIDYISSHPMGDGILSNDDETKEAVGLICAATPSYQRKDRNRIISQNLRPTTHPYYIDYLDLQRLCLQILRQEEIKYGYDKDQVYGVLFDGAWLWEEYLNTVLVGFTHPRNKTGYGHKLLFTDGTGWCYPDFYNDDMVLDAKYKGYDGWGDVNNPDLFQVISYMHILKLDCGGFIVPVSNNANRPKPKMLNGYGGQMLLLGMNADIEAESFEDFVVQMGEEEKELVEAVRKDGLGFSDSDN